MERPLRFEHHRWVGDKRNQVVHDLDTCTDEDAVAELMEAGTYLCFGPDTLTEARNRCYHACKHSDAARQAKSGEPVAAEA